jgi:hypothetical protein
MMMSGRGRPASQLFFEVAANSHWSVPRWTAEQQGEARAIGALLAELERHEAEREKARARGERPEDESDELLERIEWEEVAKGIRSYALRDGRYRFILSAFESASPQVNVEPR